MIVPFLVSLVVFCLLTVLVSWAWCKEDQGKCRATLLCTIVYATLVVGCALVIRHGAFGNPSSLGHRKYYEVLCVTRIGDKSTAVILRDGSGDIVPIMFTTRIEVNTNDLYILVSDDENNLNLAPIR